MVHTIINTHLRNLFKIKIPVFFVLNINFIRLRLWNKSSLKGKIRLMSKFVLFICGFYIKQSFPYLLRRIKTDNFPVNVLVETASFCNAHCIICPSYYLSGESPQGVMAQDLYRKIIDECSKYKVTNLLPSLHNEPLLDENIIERIEYARSRMPHTLIQLFTNASILSPEKTRQLLKYVDRFVFNVAAITKYDYEKAMPGLNFDDTIFNISYLIDYNKRKGYNKTIYIKQVIPRDLLVKKNSIKDLRKIHNFWKKKGINVEFSLLTNRAGNLKNYQLQCKYDFNKRGCWYFDIPLHSINIKFNGDVLLCCMDFRREVILGNVREKSLYEVWNGRLYNEIRDRLYLGVRCGRYKDNLICDRCIKSFS